MAASCSPVNPKPRIARCQSMRGRISASQGKWTVRVFDNWLGHSPGANCKTRFADGEMAVELTFAHIACQVLAFTMPATEGHTRDITSVAFWPPKPKLLDIALCRGISLAVLGT